MPAERLQKVMAAAGVGSRRTCEELITAGRVQVNDKTVTELGVKADPRRDRIVVDGKRLEFQLEHLYFKVHKPRGVLSDTESEEGVRRTVIDLLPPDTGRVFPVGRLDLHSEGLVLLTDDGELANRLTHPRYQHPKTYFVLVESLPGLDALSQLRTGVELPEGRSAPALVEVAERLPEELQLSKGPTEGVWLRIVLREGKKRQIRHMTAAVGYPALRLVRWSICSLTLGRLELGRYAPLTAGEVASMRRIVGLATAADFPEKRAQKPPRVYNRKPGRPTNPDAGAPKRKPARSTNPDAGASFHKAGGKAADDTAQRAAGTKWARPAGKAGAKTSGARGAKNWWHAVGKTCR